MPNPLMRLGTPKQSTEPPVHSIDPIIEHVEGQNNPYRGLEQHGVPAHYTPTDPLVDRDTRSAFFEVPPTEPDPVRVVIVNDEDVTKELRTLRAIKYSVGNTAVQVLSRNDRRVACSVRSVQASAPTGATPITYTWGVGTASPVTLVPAGQSGRVLGVFMNNLDAATQRITLIDSATGAVMFALSANSGASGQTSGLPANGFAFSNGLALSLGPTPTSNPVTITVWVMLDPPNYPVYIATRQSTLDAGDGYPLTDGSDVSLNTQDEVWMKVPSAPANTVVTVYVREDLGEKIR